MCSCSFRSLKSWSWRFARACSQLDLVMTTQSMLVALLLSPSNCGALHWKGTEIWRLPHLLPTPTDLLNWNRTCRKQSSRSTVPAAISMSCSRKSTLCAEEICWSLSPFRVSSLKRTVEISRAISVPPL